MFHQERVMNMYSSEMFAWETVILVRLLFAVFLGSLIGLEREQKNRSAGFRTHILVTVGSCIFMLVSITMPLVMMETPRGVVNNADPGRIGAQVVSGIGFLGAGAILQSKGRVKGLTTAASLWVVSAIGLAVGAGLYMTATLGTILILVVLTYFAKLECKARVKYKDTEQLCCEEQIEVADLVAELLDEYDIPLKTIPCHENKVSKK